MIWCDRKKRRLQLTSLGRTGHGCVLRAVAIVPFAFGLGDELFLLFGLGEECLRCVQSTFNGGLGDAVVLDVEEAVILRGVLDVLGKTLSRIEVAVYPADVDQGYFIVAAFSWWVCRYTPIHWSIGRAKLEFGKRGQ